MLAEELRDDDKDLTVISDSFFVVHKAVQIKDLNNSASYFSRSESDNLRGLIAK